MQLNRNTPSAGELLISTGFVHKARDSDTGTCMSTGIGTLNTKYIVLCDIVHCFPGRVGFSVV